MKVLVTGASGYVGGSVAFALLASGHRVVGLVRSAVRARRELGRARHRRSLLEEIVHGSCREAA